MVKTQIKNKEKAKEKLLKGIDIMADAVSSTLSPLGRNVAIAKANYQKKIYDRVVVHDGVTVAKSIDLKDEFENMGAQILVEAAKKQVDEVGDGTTAVIILAREIVKSAQKLIASGVNPMLLRRELEEAAEQIIDVIKADAKPIKDLEQKIQVATISSEDKVLGKLIAETLHKTGNDGVVTVEESKSTETQVEYQEGMQIDNGYISPYFVTDPTEMTATYENVDILVTDYIINDFMELLPFLKDKLLPKSNKLVVFARNITGDALLAFIQNKIEGKLYGLCIRAPYFGDLQKATLEDIAILTGATVVSKEAGFKLADIDLDYLGSASYVKSDKKGTIIVGGKGDKKLIEKRVEQLRKELKEEASEYNQEKLKERIGKLTGSIAIINVGGATEIEMKERKERVLDAVYATKAAVQEGVVVGGGIVYLYASSKLNSTTNGERILKDALKKPFWTMMENAGFDPGQKFEQIVNTSTEDMGVDVYDGEVKNMYAEGIIDPVLVPIQAIKNALSVAIQLITTDTVIVPDIKYEMSLLQQPGGKK
jgi:chaperonin GroEL